MERSILMTELTHGIISTAKNIYKSKKGFDLYTNFSSKIILNNKNIYSFLNKKNKSKQQKQGRGGSAGSH